MSMDAKDVMAMHMQRFEDALSSGDMDSVRALHSQMIQWWADISELAAGSTFQRFKLGDALLKAPQLYEAAYQFGQHHRKRDLPVARQACLYLMGSMLSALPSDRRVELEYGGDVALEEYERVQAQGGAS